LVDVWGKDLVSVRLSPNGDSQGADDATPVETFTAAAQLLDNIGIAFLELREPPAHGTYGNTDIPPVSPHIRPVFNGPLVLNSDYFYDTATEALAKNRCYAISFGRTFMTNPDLPARFAAGAELNPIDFTPTWYSQGAEGYTDYPVMEAVEVAE